MTIFLLIFVHISPSIFLKSTALFDIAISVNINAPIPSYPITNTRLGNAFFALDIYGFTYLVEKSLPVYVVISRLLFTRLSNHFYR